MFVRSLEVATWGGATCLTKVAALRPHRTMNEMSRILIFLFLYSLCTDAVSLSTGWQVLLGIS